MPRRLAPAPTLALSLAALMALAACAAPPAGPRLLTQAEIAALSQGAQTPPDTAPMEARAAGLRARAAALRRSGGEDDDLRRMRQRASQISSR